MCFVFSALKFQADMGSLLTFMFIINMVCAMTTLPALAVVLDKLFPTSKKILSRCVSIPIFVKMKKNTPDKIYKAIKKSVS